MYLFQDVVVPTVNPLVAVLALIIPIVAGWLANLAMDGLKQLIPHIDALPDVVKKVLAVVVSFLVGLAASKFGVVIDPDFHLWTAAGLTTLITVLVQQGIFRWKANNQLAAQGAATKEQQANVATPPNMPSRVADPVVPSNR
jgi:hypothetical protein